MKRKQVKGSMIERTLEFDIPSVNAKVLSNLDTDSNMDAVCKY